MMTRFAYLFLFAPLVFATPVEKRAFTGQATYTEQGLVRLPNSCSCTIYIPTVYSSISTAFRARAEQPMLVVVLSSIHPLLTCLIVFLVPLEK